MTVVARPSRDNPQSERFEGAYVNCWIDSPSADAAVERAELEVEESGWIPESIDTVVAVTRETYDRKEKGREYFEQALLDGVVLVFHTFPDEPEEDDAAH